MFHRIKSVNAMPDCRLCVQFAGGAVKVYDVKALFKEHKQFRVLENDSDLCHSVRADTGGYGVVWNDELDLSCDELFLSGKTVRAASGSADAALPGDETGLRKARASD